MLTLGIHARAGVCLRSIELTVPHYLLRRSEPTAFARIPSLRLH